jgi:hypothetical protein
MGLVKRIFRKIAIWAKIPYATMSAFGLAIEEDFL